MCLCNNSVHPGSSKIKLALQKRQGTIAETRCHWCGLCCLASVLHPGMSVLLLVQVLFYVRLLGDILGRLVPTSWQQHSTRSLLSWALAKTALLPLLLAALLQPALVGGDTGLVVLVGVFWWLSGYINTCAYLTAPRLVSMADKSRAGGLMAMCFQASCFLGLMSAFAIQAAMMSHPDEVQTVVSSTTALPAAGSSAVV